MTRWAKGEAEIEAFLADGELQHVGGASANGEPRLEQAWDRLRVAQTAVDLDPGSAFTLAYDATRLACTGLLAQQGLRPTQRGGHVVVERSMRAQFGPGVPRLRASATPPQRDRVSRVCRRAR